MSDTPAEGFDSGNGASLPTPDRGRSGPPPVHRHPTGSWINLGRIGMALALVPFAAIAVGVALGLP